MASVATSVEEAGGKLGLAVRPGSGIAHGMKDGFALCLGAGDEGGTGFTFVQVVYANDAAKDEAVREALQTSPDLEAAQVPPKKVEVKEGALLFKNPPKMLFKPGGETIAAQAEALLAVVRAPVGGRPALKCLLCEPQTAAAAATDTVLVQNALVPVCDACREKVKVAREEAKAAYDALPMNVTGGVLVGTAAGIAGALGWAALTIATHRMFWMAAIGIGLLVAFATVKAAGKAGRPVQIFAAVATLVSVLLGQTFIAAYHVREYAARQGVEVDWGAFAARIPDVLAAMGTDTIFALGGGAIGAFYAVGAAGKPKVGE